VSALGLALGGGGARGFAHIGVLRVLAQEGIRPDLIAGTSMGGLIGALTAAGATPDDIARVIAGVPWAGLLRLRPGGALLSSAALEAFFAQHLPLTFEALHQPLILTATDVLTGRAVYLYRGDLYAALRATMAYPGAIEPVALNGMLLADGGILNQVPTDAAMFLGARRIIAVDVTAPAPLDPPAQRRFLLWRRGQATPLAPALPPVRALTRALEIMQAQLTDARLSLYRPDVLLRPVLTGVEFTSFRRHVEAAQAGAREAHAHLHELRAVAGHAFGGAAMLPQDVTEGDA